MKLVSCKGAESHGSGIKKVEKRKEKCRPIPWAPGEWSDAGQTIKQRTNNTEMLVMTPGGFTHHIKHWERGETAGMLDDRINEGKVDEYNTQDVM